MALNIGAFYAMRKKITGTVWEPIILHLANNLFASFSVSVSSASAGEAEKPSQPIGMQAAAVLGTLMYYTFLNVWCWREIGAQSVTESEKAT
jgi:hypothetical protein